MPTPSAEKLPCPESITPAAMSPEEELAKLRKEEAYLEELEALLALEEEECRLTDLMAQLAMDNLEKRTPAYLNCCLAGLHTHDMHAAV